MRSAHNNRNERKVFQLGQLIGILRAIDALAPASRTRDKTTPRQAIREKVQKRAAVLGRARRAQGREQSLRGGLALKSRHVDRKALGAARKLPADSVIPEIRRLLSKPADDKGSRSPVAYRFAVQTAKPELAKILYARLLKGLGFKSPGEWHEAVVHVQPSSRAETNRTFVITLDLADARIPASQIASALQSIVGAKSAARIPAADLARFHRLVEAKVGSKSKTSPHSRSGKHEASSCCCSCCCSGEVVTDSPSRSPKGPGSRPTWPGIPDDTEWHLKQMRVKEAWNIQPPRDGRSRGEGIIIAHPDTGWREHPEYDESQLRFDLARNVIDGTDGRNATRHGTLTIPVARYETHGTGTGATIVSAEAHPERTVVSDIPLSGAFATSSNVQLTGVAPRARVIPIRCTDTTVILMDPNITKAIEYAIDIGAHVISLSLGGLLPADCEDAINMAVNRNIIVVAAAGQIVNVGRNSVIEPAAFRNSIAVAGSTPSLEPWDGSCNGPSVVVSAPAKGVWFAGHFLDGSSGIYWGDGTSFSAAEVAGVAALWLAHWGREALIARYPNVPLAHVFRQVLRNTAFRPSNWSGSYGAGIVDAFAVLSEPLPAPAEVVAPIGAAEFNLFDQFSEWMDMGGKVAADIWGAVMDGAGSVGDFFGELLTLGFLTEGLTVIRAAAEDAAGDFQVWLNEQAAVVTGMVDDSLEAAGDAWDDVVDAGEEAVEAAGDLVEEGGELMEDVGEAAEDTWNGTVDFFTSLF